MEVPFYVEKLRASVVEKLESHDYKTFLSNLREILLKTRILKAVYVFALYCGHVAVTSCHLLLVKFYSMIISLCRFETSILSISSTVNFTVVGIFLCSISEYHKDQ